MFPSPLTPLAKTVIGIVAALLLILAFWLALHFYGTHRYDEGVTAERGKWEAAAAELKADAGNAASNADANAAKSTADQIVKQAHDQEAVNQAEAEGKSPLDALFGN